MTGNDYTDDTFEIFGDSLKANKGLSTLILGSMKITDTGLGHLATGLKENTALGELNLEKVDITAAGRAVLTELLTVNSTVEITGVEPPILRPPPPPTAEPEPAPEPKPRRKKKKRTVFVAPPAAEPVDDTPEFLKVKLKKSDINYVASGESYFNDEPMKGKTLIPCEAVAMVAKQMKRTHRAGKLDEVESDGGGFLGALAMFRAKEVKDERQSELDKLDPKDREQKWKDWEKEDAGKGVTVGAVKTDGKVAKKSTVFGIPASSLTTTKLPDGSTVPVVLTVLKQWIIDANGLAAPDLFIKGAKGEGYVKAKLALNDPDTASNACTDAHAAALLLLDFLREQPGGVLSGVSSTALDAMDTEDGAVELLTELDDVMQESIAFLVEIICENVKASKAEPDAIAEVMSQAIAPTPSEEHAMLFAYNLIEYWLNL